MRVLLLYKKSNHIISYEYIEDEIEYNVLKPLIQLKTDFNLLSEDSDSDSDSDSNSHSKTYIEVITDPKMIKLFEKFNTKFKQFSWRLRSRLTLKVLGRLIESGNIKFFSNVINKLSPDTNMDSWIGYAVKTAKFEKFKLLIDKFGVQDKELIFMDICFDSTNKFLEYFLDKYSSDINPDLLFDSLKHVAHYDKIDMVMTLIRYIPENTGFISDIIQGMSIPPNLEDDRSLQIIKLLLDSGKFELGDDIFENIDLGLEEQNIEMTKLILSDVRAPTSKTNLENLYEITPLLQEDLLKYPTAEIRNVNFPLDQEISNLNAEIEKLSQLSADEKNEVFRMGYDVVIENLLLQINELEDKKLI